MDKNEGNKDLTATGSKATTTTITKSADGEDRSKSSDMLKDSSDKSVDSQREVSENNSVKAADKSNVNNLDNNESTITRNTKNANDESENKSSDLVRVSSENLVGSKTTSATEETKENADKLAKHMADEENAEKLSGALKEKAEVAKRPKHKSLISLLISPALKKMQRRVVATLKKMMRKQRGQSKSLKMSPALRIKLRSCN